MTKNKDLEYLKAAARAVELQAMENPGLGIPVDPDVAEFMGAFEEDPARLLEAEEATDFEDEEADKPQEANHV